MNEETPTNRFGQRQLERAAGHSTVPPGHPVQVDYQVDYQVVSQVS